VLNAAVTSLIDSIRPGLEAEDYVRVADGVEIPCTTFEQLRPGEWLDNWMIMAAIQMSDKPSFVHYGHCIPFDERRVQRNGKEAKRRITRPLAGWKSTIEDMPRHGQGVLVHFCPININTNHFTLLEINERQRAIYHYDSMATQAVIRGAKKLSRVEQEVQVRIGL
jgi:Ulp1 protease family, C-terminal catalytic domain